MIIYIIHIFLMNSPVISTMKVIKFLLLFTPLCRFSISSDIMYSPSRTSFNISCRSGLSLVSSFSSSVSGKKSVSLLFLKDIFPN